MKKEMIGLGLGALLVKLSYIIFVYLINPEGVFVFDSWGYLNIAHNIFYEGVFSQYSDGSLIPDSTRTPLYPLFISLFHLLGLNEWAIIIVQAVFWAISVILVYLIALELGLKKSIAILSASLLAIDPVSSYFASVIMTESLFCLLLLSLFYFLIKENFILSGIFLALAILCRPIALYLPIVLVIFMILKARKQPLKMQFRSVLLFVLPLLILVMPWGLRNKSVFGEFFISSISEVNLLFHTATNIKAKAEMRNAKEVEMEYRTELLGDLDWSSESSIKEFRERSWREFYVQLISEPITFFKIYSRSFVMFFIKPMRSYFDQQFNLGKAGQISGVMDKTPGISKVLSNTSTISLILVGLQLSVILVALLGMALNLGGSVLKSEQLILMLILILYFALSSSLSEVDARFRLPVFPFILILGLSSRKISKLFA